MDKLATLLKKAHGWAVLFLRKTIKMGAVNRQFPKHHLTMHGTVNLANILFIRIKPSIHQVMYGL
jgi:hypothetical protein